MGWGGAWRQEELKRFSSWVATKVGLSLRALGSWPGRCRGAGIMRLLPVRAAFPLSCSAWGSDLVELVGPFINLVPPGQELYHMV